MPIGQVNVVQQTEIENIKIHTKNNKKWTQHTPKTKGKKFVQNFSA